MQVVELRAPNPEDPAAAVVVGERPEPEPADGWSVVEVEAAALNMHDVWLLRGAGVRPERLPLVLGSDVAGRVGDREVIVHAVLSGGEGDDRLGPDFALLCDGGHGTFAERVLVPTANLIDKPGSLSWTEAAALPTSWLTAYRMLFTRGGLRPGATVLVQGAGGGVATAAIALASAAGATVMATSRSEEKRRRALELGADVALEPGERVPEPANIVIETVGAATWEHSQRSVARGGTIVVAGGTTGMSAPTDLARLFAREARIVGSTMGTLAEMKALVRFVERADIRPPVDSVLPFSRAANQVRRMLSGEAFGKLCLRPDGA